MDNTYPYQVGDHVLLLEDIFGGHRPQRRVIAQCCGGRSSRFLIHPNAPGLVPSWVERGQIVPYTEFADLALSELADNIEMEVVSRGGRFPSENSVQHRVDEVVDYLFD